MPLDSLLTTTVALGMTAPEASCTIPEMLPWPAPDCANAIVEERRVTRQSSNGARAVLFAMAKFIHWSLPARNQRSASTDTDLAERINPSMRPPKASLHYIQ